MPVIKKYLSEVISVDKLAENIYTVEFSPLGRGYKFLPGQFLHLALDEYDPSEAWPDSRCFSMQTCPAEKTLKITYSIKGEFTKRMAESIMPGSKVWLKLPYGDLFVQEHNKQNSVFVAGGTGITPFLSLFTDQSFSEYTNSKLYAGFRSKEFDLYDNQLQTARKLSPSFQIIKFYEDEQGVIDIHQIFSETGANATFFISGPPLMIKNFSGALKQQGVSESHIITDEWE